MIALERITVGRLRSNCYLVSVPGGDAAIVDPGDDAAEIVTRVAALGLQPRGLLATHAHDDHIGAAAPLIDEYGIELHMHSADARTLARANFSRVLARGEAAIEVPALGVDLAGRSRLRLGSLEIGVLHTPGHTPGGVCFEVGDELLSGDTLLAGGAGRTDFPEGDADALAASLALLAERYPAQTVLRPGHGRPARLREALGRPPAPAPSGAR